MIYCLWSSKKGIIMNEIIDTFSELAKKYLEHIDQRRVFPLKKDLDKMKALDVTLQKHVIDPLEVLRELDSFGSPATVASTGPRYFGFVTGGVLPAALGANLLAGVWDQNAGIEASSPISSYIEKICQKWLVDILKFPLEIGVGFVSGATMANFTCLASARYALLKKRGWDVQRKGLTGAPRINVIVGEEVHVSVLKALNMLGLGSEQVIQVPADDQGRMIAEKIPIITEPTIICTQAGNVNTGSFDPIKEICDKARSSDAWVHVDGAFGLWALASSRFSSLTKGLEKADSWGTDAHKWLNVPYDSGIAFVRHQSHLLASMSTDAAYLVSGKKREPHRTVPEISRRARGLEIWAALRSLGKEGLVDLIEANCDAASLFADTLREAGFEVLNDVVLNQILVSFGDSKTTKTIIQKIQEDGTCWCGGTKWQGHTAMRISISSWKTSLKDIEKSAEMMIRIAEEEVKK
ncbi:MAG: aspartate aminotransferase family protein [Candidatus Aminicenantes bacterium]|nr:aspartate aminotransferase family protein [Candidatus Aminicenantes bacterium]